MNGNGDGIFDGVGNSSAIDVNEEVEIDCYYQYVWLLGKSGVVDDPQQTEQRL